MQYSFRGSVLDFKAFTYRAQHPVNQNVNPPEYKHLVLFHSSLLTALLDVLPLVAVPTENSPLESWQADREIWEAYSQLDWFKGQQQEPKFSHNGKSIFSQWLNKLTNADWECCAPLDTPATWCRYTIKRHDRAIVHIRRHLGHKPFPCEDQCGREGWYVPKVFPNI